MNILSPSFRFIGNLDKAKNLKSFALKHYNSLVIQTKKEGLSSSYRTISLLDGSIIHILINRQSIYDNWIGNIDIVSTGSSRGIVKTDRIFAFIVSDNLSKRLVKDTISLEQSTIVSIPGSNWYPLDNPPTLTTPAVLAYYHQGKFCCYDNDMSINLEHTRYNNSTEYTNIVGSTAGFFYLELSATQDHLYGTSIVINSKRYAIPLFFGESPSFTSSNGSFRAQPASFLSINALSKLPTRDRNILIHGSPTSTSNIFTTFSDHSPVKMLDGASLGSALGTRILRLIDAKTIPAATGKTIGTVDVSYETVVTLPSGYTISTRFFYAYSELTPKALKYYFDPTLTTLASKAYLVTVTIDSNNVDQFHKALIVRKQLVDSSLNTGTPSTVTSFDLTESDMSLNTDPSVLPFHNRVKSSILGPYEVVTFPDGIDYFCYIRKENTYTVGSITNIMTEVVKAYKINLETDAITSFTIDTTSFTENHNVGVDPGPTFIASSTHIMYSYYCDYVNDVYVYGKIELSGDIVIGQSAPYNIILNNNSSTSILKTSSFIFNTPFNRNYDVFDPIQTNKYTPWGLWSSFRGISLLDRLGYCASPRFHQRYIDIDGSTKGVFTATIPADFSIGIVPEISETKYTIVTTGSTTTTKEIETVSGEYLPQVPFILRD